MLLMSVGLISVLASPCSGQTNGTEQDVDFSRQIQPILAKRCFACHGPDEAEGGLRFTSQEDAFAEADSGEHAIVAGDVGRALPLQGRSQRFESAYLHHVNLIW